MLRNKNLRKFLAMLLIAVTIVTTSNTGNASAKTDSNINVPIGNYYYDGVEFEVTMDKDFNILMSAVNIKEEFSLTYHPGRKADVKATDKNGKLGEYQVEDINLKNNRIEADIYKNDVKIDKIDKQINNYDGQVPLVIGITAYGTYILINLALSVIITYQIVQILNPVASDDQYEYFEGYAMSRVIQQDSSKQTYYYPAILGNNTVLISPTRISKDWAIAMVRAGGSLYTWMSNNAASVITSANYSCTNPEIHAEGYGTFFYHFHPVINHQCHSWYGVPIVKL